MSESKVPEVIDGVCVFSKGTWDVNGKAWQVFNLVFADGRQTSIMLKPGEDLENKVKRTKEVFNHGK